MKYIVLLCDGMADLPVAELGGATPMQKAKKPNMDTLAKTSAVGMVKTVDVGLKPGSDVANLSVMGFDPLLCYTGRSPLEAASIGIDLEETDVAVRCNLVTLSDERDYEDCVMVDYCADDISTAEADQLIKALEEALGDDTFKFYTGVAYRHCLIWKKGKSKGYFPVPPHDISGLKIDRHLDGHRQVPELLELMKKSREVLENHPVNLERIKRGRKPANSCWLWGQGSKPILNNFYETHGIKGAVISAVDLLKGIAKCAGMTVIDVEGATGYIDTNFEGKLYAALNALKDHDYVYIHVEAPDECGHRREIQNKVKAIELIDEKILGPLLKEMKEDFTLLICPDHPTPLASATHSSDPVPFMIYRSNQKEEGVDSFTEENASATGLYLERGPQLIKLMLK